jgi:UDP-N-acetylmuramyl pentapeptide synthase
MVSTDHLRQELVAQLGRAAQAGRIDVLINSAELSRSIRGDFKCASCCDAMQAEIRPGDTVLLDRSNGVGMTVRYLLPRIDWAVLTLGPRDRS